MGRTETTYIAEYKCIYVNVYDLLNFLRQRPSSSARGQDVNM